MVDREREVARLVSGLFFCALFTALLLGDRLGPMVGWRIFFFTDAKLQAVWAGAALLAFGLGGWPSLRWAALVGALFYFENLYSLVRGEGPFYFVELGVLLTLALVGTLVLGRSKATTRQE